MISVEMNKTSSGFPFKCNPRSPVGGVRTSACKRWEEQSNGQGEDEEVDGGGAGGGEGEVQEEVGVVGGGGEGGGLADGLSLH